jgi:hypothetical protein
LSLKVLYIDAVYPYEWLEKRQAEQDIASMEFPQYREWLLGQRIYLSDYISANLRANGFVCEELIVNDPVFMLKLERHLKNKKRTRLKNKHTAKSIIKKMAHLSPVKLFRALRPDHYQKLEFIIQKAWEVYQPDIIFVREPTGINTYFWNRFRHRSLVAGLIGCNTSHPYYWLSHNYDVLFSITEEYLNFFKAQGLPSYFFSYGLDERVYNELSCISGKKYDVVFTGSLGNGVQSKKTHLLEKIASQCSFHWWGPDNVLQSDFPALFQAYQGKTSGIEMLKIYRQSKIVLNDYVNTANGSAVNLRLYEVLNVGSFLLTRNAENLQTIFPKDILVTYESEEDCLQKIIYYLLN